MRSARIYLVLLVALVTGACGYHFTGGGEMLGGIRSIHVDILKNKTFETGIENRFASDLVYEITRSGKVKLAERDAAEGILSGTIRNMTVSSISHTNVNVSQERRVVVTVDLTLTGQDGTVLWSAPGLTEREEYLVDTGDKYKTERQRRAAVEKLSRRFAEKVYLGMTTKF